MGNDTLLTSYLVVCLLFIAGLMWIQHNRRTVMLISTRNMFLVGFAYFQIISVLYWLHGPPLYEDMWRLNQPRNDARQFMVMSALFLSVFLLAYKYLRFIEKRPQRFIFQTGASGDSFLLLMALGMSLISFAMQMGIGNRYVAILSLYAGISMGAAACGLAAWVLIGRFRNPLIVSYCVGIVGLNMVGQLGGFSRRGLLSMGLAILWAAFYRYIHTKRTGYLAFIL